MIKARASYETTDPTVDFNNPIASVWLRCPRHGSDPQIRLAGDKEDGRTRMEAAAHPERYRLIRWSDADAAGLENAKKIISDTSFKDTTDPQWLDDAGYKQWAAFMDKYYPDGDKIDNQTVYGYSMAQTTVQVLKQCGDELTRENVMKQCASMHDFELPMVLPGIAINTSATDFQMIKQSQMRRFNGERYVPFGPILSGAAVS